MDQHDFDVENFKKWMDGHQDEKVHFNKAKNPLIGIQIESKLPFKKLIEVIIPEEGESTDVAYEFKKNGGIITDVDDNYLLVQVECGNFHISKRYTRKV